MLKRFLSVAVTFLVEVEDRGLVRAVVGAGVRDAGTAGVLRIPGGLVNEDRDVVVVAFLAGVGVDAVDGRDVVVDGARDILLGLADMPSLFLSSEASTELREVRLRWEGVLDAGVELVGFFTVETLGRAGGLFRVAVGDVFVAEVAVGLVRVEVRGATGLVSGRLGGTPEAVRVLAGLVDFSSVREASRSAISTRIEEEQTL